MDPHIIERFEKAQPLPLGEVFDLPEYDHGSTVALNLENMMEDCFGGEVARLMREYAFARGQMERLACLHYFHQGLLEAQKEP